LCVRDQTSEYDVDEEMVVYNNTKKRAVNEHDDSVNIYMPVHINVDVIYQSGGRSEETNSLNIVIITRIIGDM
jgi:hypothetical protein